MRIVLSLLALAAGAGLLAAAAERGRVSLPPVERVTAIGTLAGGARFGDAVDGRLDVLVPVVAADPGSVRWSPAFAPHAVAGQVRIRRYEDGPTALVRYEFALECLTGDCLPANGRATYALPPATVRYADAAGAPRSVAVGWPSIATASRRASRGADPFAWRAGLDALPALGTRLPPRALALALLSAALLASLASLALLLPRAVRAVPRRRPPADRRAVRDRALDAVRSAAGIDDVAERRRALDLLARELRAGARRDEARTARRLAWSRRAPARAEMERLADRVERRV